MTGKTDALNIKSLLLEEDILLLGDFETVPVHSVSDGLPESYGDVVRIKDIEWIEELEEEAQVIISHMEKKFIRERAGAIVAPASVNEVLYILNQVGFTRDTYQAYSLRKLGTNILEDFVKGRTRQLFTEMGFPCFRMQYAVAQPGWETQFHIDHKNFRRHGFKAMVPLKHKVILSFLKEDGIKVYELTPGSMYFVNIAKLHRGFNPFLEERQNLLFQMSTDRLVLDGEPVLPLDKADAEVRYGKFQNNQVASFWR